MARILITGSSDGLGQLAARQLIANGHTVYLHARNSARATDAKQACPGAADVLIADLSRFAEIRKMANEINSLSDKSRGGPLDCIVHNAGLYTGPYRATDEGYPSLFMVNVVAPYMLTCLVQPAPKRLVYASSALHRSGNPQSAFADFGYKKTGEKGWSAMQAYSDSKLFNIMFAKAFARRWGGLGVTANAVDPGWVATKMGGPHATDDLDAAVRTYVMLAEGTGMSKGQTGRYWYQEREGSVKEVSDDEGVQGELLRRLEEVTGVKAPKA